MAKHYRPPLATVALERARELRSKLTDAERELWLHLRAGKLNGRKFRRQHPIPPYTVDFFCASAKLVIELDGSQHNEKMDAARTRALEKLGFKILRFWDNEVLTQTEAVLEAIWNVAAQSPLTPTPLPLGEGLQAKVNRMSIANNGFQSGFGNEFATEAVAGTLPVGRNSPQVVAHGLYAEQLSGTAFTAPRHQNRRSWLYRIRPAALHGEFSPFPNATFHDRFDEMPATPNQLRWSPRAIPDVPTGFIDGLFTVAGNGSAAAQHGIGIHLYAANRSMQGRWFYSADGELLIVPQQGRLRIATDLGVLAI